MASERDAGKGAHDAEPSNDDANGDAVHPVSEGSDADAPEDVLDDAYDDEYDDEYDDGDLLGHDPAEDDIWTAPDGPRPHRGRLVAGAVLVVIGLIVSIAAYGAFTEDEPDEQGRSRAASTTTDPAAASSKGTTTTSKPPVARWPGAVGGRPPQLGADGDPVPAESGDLDEGFYLWQDFNGWHLWMVGGQEVDASVEIRADDAFTAANPVGGEPDILQDRNLLVLGRGGADERVVGVDFNPGFYAKTMVVTTTGFFPMHLGALATPAGPYVGLQFSTGS